METMGKIQETSEMQIHLALQIIAGNTAVLHANVQNVLMAP